MENVFAWQWHELGFISGKLVMLDRTVNRLYNVKSVLNYKFYLFKFIYYKHIFTKNIYQQSALNVEFRYLFGKSR